MKFKVNKIAAAVAVSLGTSVVGMNVAQADELFFPNLVTSNQVTTILSVINDDESAGVTQLHYAYYYKAPGGTNCEEVNYNQPTSPNDIVTYDIGGRYGNNRAVLFEPTSVKAVYDKDFAVFRNIKPVRAFLLVDNNGRNFGTFFPGQGIEGEAFIIEFTKGSVWGYRGYNAAEIVGWQNGAVRVANPFDFSDRVEVNGEVLVDPTVFNPNNSSPDNYWAPIAIMPWAETIQTALFVTPVATDQRNGALSTDVTLAVNDPRSSGLDVMYDRDENPFSGRRIATVTCVDRVDLPTLISAATRQFVEETGGWSNVVVLNGPGRTGQAVVMKLEYNDTPPADLDGVSTGSDSWNNGDWLRKGFRESVARRTYPAVTGPAQWMPVFAVPKDETLNAPFPLVNVAALPADGSLPWPPGYGADPVPYLPFASAVQ